MTTKNPTPAQAAARRPEWTPEQRAAYEVGQAQANAFHLGYRDGLWDVAPYGSLEGRKLGGLIDALQITGPTNAAYRGMLARAYRQGRRTGFEAAATEWCECDDEALNDLAELGYDDEAGS